MSRRLRWITLAAVVLVVIAAGALVLTQQPDLADARDRVDARWVVLRPQAQRRYATLEPALEALTDAGFGERDVTVALTDDLERWKQALRRKDAGDEVEAANRLEADAARLRANQLLAPRLGAVAPLTAAMTTFFGTAVDTDQISQYNQAALDHQKVRTGTFARPVAAILGYGERHTYAYPT
jgi:hypothetical protein